MHEIAHRLLWLSRGVLGSCPILETGDIDAQGAEENEGALAIQQSIWLRSIMSRNRKSRPAPVRALSYRAPSLLIIMATKLR
jgi:hypothetical protein